MVAAAVPQAAPQAGRLDGAREAADEDSTPAVNLATLPSPIPRAGLLFFGGMIVGPVCIGLGLWFGLSWLVYAGIAVTALVLLVLLLGQLL